MNILQKLKLNSEISNIIIQKKAEKHVIQKFMGNYQEMELRQQMMILQFV